MAKIVEKILRILIDVLIVVVAIAIALVIYGKVEMKLSHHNYSNYFGYTLFKVTSGSMGKAVEIDDVVLVKITKDIKKNEIITFQSGNTFITHRVISIKDDVIITKGDANNSKDVSITKDDVLGKVVHIFRGLELWKKVLSTPKVLISIFITLILFDLAFSYKDKKEGKKNKFDQIEKLFIDKPKKKKKKQKKNDKFKDIESLF